jgi:hypothetical protein
MKLRLLPRATGRPLFALLVVDMVEMVQEGDWKARCGGVKGEEQSPRPLPAAGQDPLPVALQPARVDEMQPSPFKTRVQTCDD